MNRPIALQPLVSATESPFGFAFDQRLPWRDLALDESAMAIILGDAIGTVVRSCRRVRTKYRVGESLRVSYDIATNQGSQRVSIRCFPAGSRPAIDSALRSPVELPELNGLGWVFPDDRKLRSLGPFMTDHAVQRQVLNAEPDGLTLVSYAPEKAATIRCRVGGDVIGFTKLYTGGRHRQAATAYEQLEPQLVARGFAAPKLLHCDDDYEAIVISALTGETMAARRYSFDWYRLGQAMAILHQVDSIEGLDRFGRATLPRLRSVAHFVTTVRPDVADDVHRLLDRLDERSVAIGDGGPDVVLHGDLHGKNVLVHGAELGFIDLDQAATGPAAAELGSAIAALRAGPTKSKSRSRAFESHLLRGYADTAPLPPPEVLSWFVAAALLGERVVRAVNRVRPDGLERLPELVMAAAETADGRWSV